MHHFYSLMADRETKVVMNKQDLLLPEDEYVRFYAKTVSEQLARNANKTGIHKK